MGDQIPGQEVKTNMSNTDETKREEEALENNAEATEHEPNASLTELFALVDQVDESETDTWESSEFIESHSADRNRHQEVTIDGKPNSTINYDARERLVQVSARDGASRKFVPTVHVQAFFFSVTTSSWQDTRDTVRYTIRCAAISVGRIWRAQST